MTRRRRRRSSQTYSQRRKTRVDGGSTNHNVAWSVLGVAALAILGGAFWFMNSLEKSPLDDALCPADGPTAGTVIILDMTDSVGRGQNALIRQKILSVIKQSETGTLFAVGLVRTEEEERGARFVICKPRSGLDANEFYENPRMIKELYEAEFRIPLDMELEAMLSSGVADSSPIMESLQATLSDASGFADASYPRRLILVSDLLQHSSVFSFYHGDTWQKFLNSNQFQRLARNLVDVNIEILRLPRPGANIPDWAEVDDFWVNYFEHQGVAQVYVSTIGDL